MDSSDHDTHTRVLSTQEQVRQLWCYQSGLRLRHLVQILARNLDGHKPNSPPRPACPLPTVLPRAIPTLGYYYTLHVPGKDDDNEIYRSELQSSINPTWREIEQESINPINHRSLKGILIRLWFKPDNEAPKLVTSWGVHFSGLIPLGESLPTRQDGYQTNCLIFKLRHVYYTAAGCYKKPDNCVYKANLLHCFTLPLSETKRSYTVSALSRLHSTKRAQRQQELRWNDHKELLESKGVIRNSDCQILATKVEECRIRVALLREQLESQIDKLRTIKLYADNMDNQNQEKGLELLGGYQGLHRQLVKARGSQDIVAGHIDALKDGCVCLGSWRTHLITQLPSIYPITEENGEYKICGVQLPDAENYDGVSESQLSAALGFVAHLLQLLSQLMHLPLRYPVKPYGSVATITDVTSLQLRDSEREFPLYTRGKERERLHFNYGVFLLNKNIAQMRWYCGISTPDLRATLPNLHILINKLAINSHTERNQGSAVMMPDVLLPIPATSSIQKLQVHTPETLIEQHQTPRLPLNPIAPLHINRGAIGIGETNKTCGTNEPETHETNGMNETSEAHTHKADETNETRSIDKTCRTNEPGTNVAIWTNETNETCRNEPRTHEANGINKIIATSEPRSHETSETSGPNWSDAASPISDTLYVREADPLSSGTTGKFVFVDKVKDPLTSEGLQNGLSFSLDGLNHIGSSHHIGSHISGHHIGSHHIGSHIGGKSSQYQPYNKDLSSCDDLKLSSGSALTSTLTYGRSLDTEHSALSSTLSSTFGRGSDPSLLVTSDEANLPVFKEQTTEILRSWHEDYPSYYTGALECSTDRLEEVGVECDESFMCGGEQEGGREREEGREGEKGGREGGREERGREGWGEGGRGKEEGWGEGKEGEEGRRKRWEGGREREGGREGEEGGREGRREGWGKGGREGGREGEEGGREGERRRGRLDISLGSENDLRYDKCIQSSGNTELSPENKGEKMGGDFTLLGPCARLEFVGDNSLASPSTSNRSYTSQSTSNSTSHANTPSANITTPNTPSLTSPNYSGTPSFSQKPSPTPSNPSLTPNNPTFTANNPSLTPSNHSLTSNNPSLTSDPSLNQIDPSLTPSNPSLTPNNPSSPVPTPTPSTPVDPHQTSNASSPGHSGSTNTHSEGADDSQKSSHSGPELASSLSELGITEDMFLNDVAFRTAALASQNFSFKMSFSRQSTEDEFH